MKPILFSTPMVQAILEGRKTMTRRIVKGIALDWLQPQFFTPKYVASPENNLCPYGQPGDILWVRESFKYELVTVTGDPVTYYYKADNPDAEGTRCRFKPSIHMPFVAARIFLKIKSVAVERLQDIQRADILAEGVRYNVAPVDEKGFVNPVFKIEDNSALSFMPDGWKIMREKELTPILLFAHWAELWCKINGRQSWDANPWVWVVSFERTEKPI